MTQVARADFAKGSSPRALVVVTLALLLGATPLFAQADWSAVRPMPMVTVELRKLVGYMMVVPAVTLFLLYMFRLRTYVLAGAATWIAGSIMMLVLSFDSGPPNPADTSSTVSVGRLAAATWAIATLAFGAAIELAARWFRAPVSISRSLRWLFPLAVAWTIVAAIFMRPLAVVAPAFILMSVWQARGAFVYFNVARAQRLVGPLLSGLGAAAMALVNAFALAVAATSGGIGTGSSRVAYVNFVAAGLLAVGMHLLIFEDVIEELSTAAAELATSRDEMRAMATTDPLTKCYNRRFLHEIAERELERHRRYNLPLSLLYLDVDRFKAINDQRGHQTGDEVLKTVGAILNELTRKGDFVFRWGGDEFLVLLSAAERDARKKGQQIRQAFCNSAIVHELPAGVDISVGVVGVPPEARDLAALIDQADREMYRRKRTVT